MQGRSLNLTIKSFNNLSDMVLLLKHDKKILDCIFSIPFCLNGRQKYTHVSGAALQMFQRFLLHSVKMSIF